MTVQIDVELNNEWRDDIGELYTEFKALDGESIDLDVDVSRAMRDVEALRTEVETLTDKTHEVEVKTNLDRNKIQESLRELNDLELEDVNLNVGDLEGLDDLEKTVKIRSEIDEDDDFLKKALTDDKEDLRGSGVIQWSSRGGYGPSRSGGTIEWDSDVDYTSFVEELQKAKAQAKASGASTIEWGVQIDEEHGGDLNKVVRDLHELKERDGNQHFTVSVSRDVSYSEYVADEYTPEDKEATIWYDERIRRRLNLGDEEREISVGLDMEDDDRDLLERLADKSGSSHTYTTTNHKRQRFTFDREDSKRARGEFENFRDQLKGDGLLDDIHIGVDIDYDRDKMAQKMATLLDDIGEIDTEYEIEVCVKRCDDWKQNLNRIHRDLNTVTDWEEREGEVNVKLRGAIDDLNDSINKLEDNGMETVTDGGDTDIEKMAQRAGNTGKSLHQQALEDAGMASGDGDSGGGGGDRDGPVGWSSERGETNWDSPYSQPGWTKEDRKWLDRSQSAGIVPKNDRQRDLIDTVLGNLGIKDYGDGDVIQRENLRDKNGNFISKPRQTEVMSELARVLDRGATNDQNTRDWSDHGEFSIPGFGDGNDDRDGDLDYKTVKPNDIDDVSVEPSIFDRADMQDRLRDEYGSLDAVPDDVMAEEERKMTHESARRQWNMRKRMAREQTEANRQQAKLGRDRAKSAPDAFDNVLNKQYGETPLGDRSKGVLSRLGLDMPDSGLMDDGDSQFDDRFGSPLKVWAQNMARDGKRKRLGIDRNLLGSLGEYNGVDDKELSNFMGSKRDKKGKGIIGSLTPDASGMKTFKNQLGTLVPTMAKYWQFIALLSPMLITLAGNALGVAAAFGSVAAAGGAVLGLGLLGFGDTLGESMDEARQRINQFKKDMFGVFQPVFQQFAPFTDEFLTTMPIRIQPIADSMGGLTTFMDSFNAGIDGAIDWVARFIDTVVALEPIMSQMAARFGKLIGDILIDGFVWLVEMAYENQDVMIQVAAAIGGVLSILWKLAQVMTYLVAIFSPLIRVITFFTDLISPRWFAALTTAILTMAAAVGILTGAFSTLTSVSFAGMAASIAAFAAKAIVSFIAAAEALAVLIAGQATLLTMTGAGIALVAAGVAAGYMAYKAIAPKGGGSKLGSGAGGGAGLPGSGAGGGGGGGYSSNGRGFGGSGGDQATVINVEGDVTRKSMPRVEDAIDRAMERDSNRNPDA